MHPEVAVLADGEIAFAPAGDVVELAGFGDRPAVGRFAHGCGVGGFDGSHEVSVSFVWRAGQVKNGGVLVIRGTTPAETAAIMVSPAGYSDSKMGLVFERNAETPVLSAVKLSSGLMVTVIPAVPTKGVALSHP
jgi:hypothetical protein